MGQILPDVVFRLLDSSANPVSGGTATFYLTGTSTLTNIYADADLNTALPNPISTNSAGLFLNASNQPTAVYFDPLISYRAVFKNAVGATLRDIDPVASPVVASSVAFLQSGTGAVQRPAQDKLRESVSVFDFGAVGDGAVDDTVNIQKALTASLEVFVPPGTYEISAALALRNNQRVIIAKGALIRQVTDDEVVFDGNGVSNVLIEGGGFIEACGTMTGETSGCGVRTRNGSTRCTVRDVFVTNHRGYGVLFLDTTDSLVTGCRFLDSPVVDADIDNTVTGDIGFIGDSSRNIAIGNFCTSGNGVGVTVQTLANGDEANDNVVNGNVIDGCKIYGICFYRTDPTLHDARNNIASGNTITNTTGSIKSLATDSYTFGCAIYIQGAEGSVVTGNTIDGTHTAARAFAETLAPGAIGIAETTHHVVSDNYIDNAGWHGIVAANANGQGETVGMGLIDHNVLVRVTKIGIYIKERGLVTVTNNSVDTTGEQGFLLANTTTKRRGVFIRDNAFYNITGAGFAAGFIANGEIVGNYVQGNANYPFAFANMDDCRIERNTAETTTGFAFIVDTTCLRTLYLNNHAIGSSGTAGHELNARPLLSAGNTATGFTAVYSGTYATSRTAIPASGTWVVGDKVENSAPAASGFIGWVCVTAPNTFKTYGAISA